jgi:hypothetical protein
MDDDDLRRGRPTVHRVYGGALATLAGAALLPLGDRVLDGGGAALGLDRRSVAAETGAGTLPRGGAQGMVGGQLLDLERRRGRWTAPALERSTGARRRAALRRAAAGRHGRRRGRSACSIRSRLRRGARPRLPDHRTTCSTSPADAGRSGRRPGATARTEQGHLPRAVRLDGARSLARSARGRWRRCAAIGSSTAAGGARRLRPGAEEMSGVDRAGTAGVRRAGTRRSARAPRDVTVQLFKFVLRVGPDRRRLTSRGWSARAACRRPTPRR